MKNSSERLIWPVLIFLVVKSYPLNNTCLASPLQIYFPPSGLWLIPSDHSNRLYGATKPNANWAVAQWDIPEDLPSFDRVGIAENQFAKVAFRGKDGYLLEQKASDRPCERLYPSGKSLTNEFDLLIQPNNGNTPNYPGANASIDLPLSELKSVRHEITIKPLSITVLNLDCKLTQADFVTSIVFTNKFTKQTFFYQIRLSLFKVYQNRMQSALNRPQWFFKGDNIQSGGSRQYGYGDNITEYSQPAAIIGSRITYKLDILSRIKALIIDGGIYALDQNLKHWKLTGTYHGSGAWGHIGIAALWSNFLLEAE